MYYAATWWNFYVKKDIVPPSVQAAEVWLLYSIAIEYSNHTSVYSTLMQDLDGCYMTDLLYGSIKDKQIFMIDFICTKKCSKESQLEIWLVSIKWDSTQMIFIQDWEMKGQILQVDSMQQILSETEDSITWILKLRQSSHHDGFSMTHWPQLLSWQG